MGSLIGQSIQKNSKFDMRIFRLSLFKVRYFGTFAFLNLDGVIFFWQFSLLKKIIFFTWRVNTFFPFVKSLNGNTKRIFQAFVVLRSRLSDDFSICLIVEWYDVGRVYSCLAFFSIKEDFVRVVLGEDPYDFSWPIRVVLAFGENHLVESKLAHPQIYIYDKNVITCPLK